MQGGGLIPVLLARVTLRQAITRVSSLERTLLTDITETECWWQLNSVPAQHSCSQRELSVEAARVLSGEHLSTAHSYAV